MRRRLLTILCAIIAIALCMLSLIACASKPDESGDSGNIYGTYYFYSNNSYDKYDYFILEDGKWSSSRSGVATGSAEYSSDTVSLYITFMGNREEFCHGTVKNGVFRIDRLNGVNIDYKYYCKEGVTPPANAPIHSLTHTAAVAETCTTDGNIEFWTCAACGKIFSDANGKIM